MFSALTKSFPSRLINAARLELDRRDCDQAARTHDAKGVQAREAFPRGDLDRCRSRRLGGVRLRRRRPRDDLLALLDRERFLLFDFDLVRDRLFGLADRERLLGLADRERFFGLADRDRFFGLADREFR